MIKIIFLALFSAATAGVIHDHFGPGPGPLVFGPAPAAPVVHAAPVLHAAPVAHAATSFANSNLIAVHPHAVAVAPAPVVHAAPIAPAPLLLEHGFGAHGFYGHH